MNTITDGALFEQEPPDKITGRFALTHPLRRDDFIEQPPPGKKLCGAGSLGDAPYLILGFDTEFKGPNAPVERSAILAGKANYLVLSYQYHAKTSTGDEWNGIYYPTWGERITLPDFLTFALGSGARKHGIKNLPTKIYMAGHFTRADIPAFADFKDVSAYISNVRNTFISIDQHKKYPIPLETGDKLDLSVLFRDTMLLAPQANHSLKAIGELLGVPKIELDPDPARAKYYIKHMDEFLRDNPVHFERYALNDALVCVRYIERIIQQYEEVTGKKKVPVTLTSIGVDTLLKSWKEKLQLSHLDALGREEHLQRVYDKKLGYFVKRKVEVPLEEVHLHMPIATECYHGGRNEQFWFGPGFEDRWNDYDLSSAYPTAMSLIGKPDWRAIRVTSDLNDFQPTTLGYAMVDFEFPADTRYPVLPVRTDHGLVFPLCGRSFCSSPELVVARNLGAKITIRHGVVVPTDNDVLIFGEFIRDCLQKRKEAGPKTLSGLFWKEISNSTYGKTAQGLREKRVYDMSDRKMRPLPPSRITNPFFASFITSFVRAILGEIINGLPATTCVFSCTTDGFLTNASDDEIERAQQGELALVFADARKTMTGSNQVLEIKHTIRQPLGWRTRGQATLKPGVDLTGDENYVLAKGGIYTPPGLESRESRSEYIVELFFDRTPESKIEVHGLTGVRDIVELGADLVEKIIDKRLSMEFDWKRRPWTVGTHAEWNHIAFSTHPWKSVYQFNETRRAWDAYTKGDPQCIKSVASFDRFATYLETFLFRDSKKGRYLAKENGDIKRLRILLCSAWKHSMAGLDCKDGRLSATEFAALLTSAGVLCKRTDVENGLKQTFEPHNAPPTPAVKEALWRLKETSFPTLDIDEFHYRDESVNAVSIRGQPGCPFMATCCEEAAVPKEDPIALPSIAFDFVECSLRKSPALVAISNQ